MWSASRTGPPARTACSTAAQSWCGSLRFSTMDRPLSAHFPDSGKLLFRDADGSAYIFREVDAVGYWDGEV